jgi:hypothetical protein
MLFRSLVILAATAWATTMEPGAPDLPASANQTRLRLARQKDKYIVQTTIEPYSAPRKSLGKQKTETKARLTKKKQASIVQSTMEPYSADSVYSESSPASTQEPDVPSKRCPPGKPRPRPPPTKKPN